MTVELVTLPEIQARDLAASIPRMARSPWRLRLSLSHLPHDRGDVRDNGWICYMPAMRVHWCGHGQEIIPIPGEDGKCDLVLVIRTGW